MREKRRILDLYRSSKLVQSRNKAQTPKAQTSVITIKPLTISAPEMAHSKLGLNDRVIFNRDIIDKLCGIELDIQPEEKQAWRTVVNNIVSSSHSLVLMLICCFRIKSCQK